MSKEALEIRVIFHDPSHLQFKKTKNGHVFRTGQYQPLFIKFDQNILKFYAERYSDEEVCSVSTQRMSVEVDKNANIISFVYHNNQDPTLEIRSDINTLEKIEHHVTTASKLSYKSPLAYTPANRHRETVFTTGDNSVNLKGFLNLALIALVFAKFRDIIKNFLAYGMIATAAVEVSITLSELICYCLSASGPTLFIWFLEKQGLKKKIPDSLIDFLSKVNVVILLIIPIVVCNVFKPHPVSGIMYVTAMIGNVLKMCSYIDVMGHLRRNVPKILKLHKDGKDVIATLGEHIISKENLEIILQRSDDPSKLASFKELCYFLTVPTFCYQLWYPRNAKIRWGFLAKRICENTICWALFSFVMSQYIVPLMDESVEILQKGSILAIIERVIRLAFPVTVCWILFFFGIFQFTFNILAEIQRFSDRMFYKDWWNCRDLNEYWRLWNLPIHEFFTRHVYYPLLSKGYSKSFAKLVVFFLSAVAHEYWASVPLRLIAAWAFLLMLIQLPLMLLELKIDKMLKGSQIGNIFFWISFCFVGQPMALLLYYQLYITKHGDSS